MIRNYFIFITISIFFLIVSSGCSISSKKIATISVNSDSEYVNTFEDLNLGILYDFDFKLPNADSSWVNVWVESYKDGVKEPQPLSQLSYGLSPKKVEEGNVGFGIINPNTDTPLVFLYGPNVSTTPQKIEKINSPGMFSGWEYAIDDRKVELNLGKTYLLGVYRQSSQNSIRTYDLQDEDEVKKMITEDNMVFLLKIKIEKNGKSYK